MIYLLLFDHYDENSNEEDEQLDTFGAGCDEDTLAAALDRAIAALPKQNHPPGHPKYVRRGVDLVEAAPGSPEAGYARIGGYALKKL